MTVTTEDRFEIEQSVHRSVAALDDGDSDTFVSVWAEDALFELNLGGKPTWSRRGHAELRDFCETCRPWGLPPVHGVYHVTAVLFVAQDEGSVRTRSTVVSTMQWEGQPTIHSHGVYHDEWSRTGAGWRLVHRRFEASGTWPVAPATD